MATKTIVCPECGSAVAPGRYACAACGSLLAAVTAAPRTWGSRLEPIAVPEAEGAADVTDDDETTDAVETADAVEPATEPVPAALAEPAAPAVPTAADSDPATDAEPATDSDPATDAEPATDTEPAPAASTAMPPSLAEAPIAAVAATAASPMAAAPVWPPAGNRGPSPLPVARTPAGAYLPPSAFLDALDPAASTTAGTASTAGRAATGTAATTEAAGSSRAAGRRGLVDSFDLSEDVPRTIIAVGAGVSALGFLLPWANVLAGAGLLGGYFTQWGLAGPGAWIVLTLLVAMVGVAIAGAPTARWPVGLAATALATLLVGMLWPYLFGFLGRSVGVWTVLAGAVALAIGGILDRRDRHDRPQPPVA
jgi:hypothetical protein